MVCKVCGRNIEEEQVNYCSYCGYSFREERGGFESQYSHNVNEVGNLPKEPEPVVDSEHEKSIGFGNWMGTLLLPMIPIVGWMVYLVMLFVWAFGKGGSKSKRNWARAQIIVLLIAFMMLAYMAPVLVDMLNGGQAFYDMSI